MKHTTFIFVLQPDKTEIEFAIIDRGNGEFTSMLKSDYDEMIAQQDAAQPLL